MKHATRIAAFGLLAGSAIALATGAATAHGRIAQGGFGPNDGVFGLGNRGGLFTSAFADLDADGNGQITEEDLAALAEGRFAAVDTDGDGSLTVEEMAARIVAQIQERQAQAPGTGARMGDPEAIAKTMAERMIAARDGNEDGVLTADELAPKVSYGRTIDRFDTDDDNAISEAEYEAAKSEIGAWGQGRIDNRGRMPGNRGGVGPQGMQPGQGMMPGGQQPGYGPQGMMQGGAMWGNMPCAPQGFGQGYGYGPQNAYPQGNQPGFGPQGMMQGNQPGAGPQGGAQMPAPDAAPEGASQDAPQDGGN